jgi:hypothetical protein
MRGLSLITVAVVLGVAATAAGMKPEPAGPAVGPPPEQPVFRRAVTSSLVVSGTVSVGKETVEATAEYGQAVKTNYKVATIRVKDVLVGDKPGDTVTVLVPPADPFTPPVADGFGRPQPYRRPQVSQVPLIDGQEGVFFLSRHPTAPPHHHMPQGAAPLNPLDTDHKDHLAVVKRVGAMVADPVKSLKAKAAGDRYDAAVALVYRYKFVFGQVPAEEVAVPAEESKLLLAAIAEFDWAEFDKPFVPGGPLRDYTRQPNDLLTLLGIHQGGDTGFPKVQVNPGQGMFAAYQQTLREWLDGPGGKFVVTKRVPGN